MLQGHYNENIRALSIGDKDSNFSTY